MSDLAPFVTAVVGDDDPVVSHLQQTNRRLRARMEAVTAVEIREGKRKRTLGHSNLTKGGYYALEHHRHRPENHHLWRVRFAVEPSLSLSSLLSLEIHVGGILFAAMGEERGTSCYFVDRDQEYSRTSNTTTTTRSRSMIVESRKCSLFVLLGGVSMADWMTLEGLSQDLVLPTLAYLVSSSNPQAVARIEEVYFRPRYIAGMHPFL